MMNTWGDQCVLPEHIIINDATRQPLVGPCNCHPGDLARVCMFACIIRRHATRDANGLMF